MDGTSAKKSISLETLVIQNMTNINELKSKLNNIIKTGKEYDYDVSGSIKDLLMSGEIEILCLTVEAIAELSKCERKREIFAQSEIIIPIVNLLKKEWTSDKYELFKQCCRALGNLCCDCDMGRKVVLENGGVVTLLNLLKACIEVENSISKDVQLFCCKCLLNFMIGGSEMSEAAIEAGITDRVLQILNLEMNKEDMDDDIVSTALSILGVINDNIPEVLFNPEINCAVLNILKETINVDISEICLDHLHVQAEHDSVKTLLAKEGGVQLVCSRLELLLSQQVAGELNADDSEVDNIVKQACDLIIIVLTGDEAMNLLYNNGIGEVYLTMVQWLDSSNSSLLTTAVLAIGNFARQDAYCIHMMEDRIYEKLLDVFEVYHNFDVKMIDNPNEPHPIDAGTLIKVQHAVLSALRNLSVPAANKRTAAAGGRAVALFMSALPHVKDHHVAYKLLAAIRMLVDGQEGVARQFASDHNALAAAATWGAAVEHAGAAGEAPRLLAWTIRQLRHTNACRDIMQVDGCISCLVNMLVSSHSVMQNEAILSLTLLAIDVFNNKTPQIEQPPTFNHEKSFVTQLIKSEIGKHVSLLIDSNCAKMPIEVAENLLAFLDVTAKKNELTHEYKIAKVHESLRKLTDSRHDFSDSLKDSAKVVASMISDTDKLQ